MHVFTGSANSIPWSYCDESKAYGLERERIWSGEQDAVAEQSHAVADGLLGGEPGEFGGVVGLGEVAEDDVGGAAVVVVGEELGGGVVGEVADAGEDALLDRPGVGAVAEHLEVVVGFEQEDVDALEGGLDVGRHVAEVGGDGHADGLGAGLEDEAAGVGGVVGDGEGRDVDVADGEVGAGVEVLDGGKVGGVGFFFGGGAAEFVLRRGRRGVRGWRWDRRSVRRAARRRCAAATADSSAVRVADSLSRFGCSGSVAAVCGGAGFFFALDVIEPLGVGHGGAGSDHADPGAVGGLGEEDGDVEAAGEDGEAGDVVDVLVGDEDGVEGGGIFAGEGHAA